MHQILIEFDQLLASALGVLVGACGCWLVLLMKKRRQQKNRHSFAYTETPAITAAAQLAHRTWNEADQLLDELQDCLKSFQTPDLPASSAVNLNQAQKTLLRLHFWIGRQKRSATLVAAKDTAAELQQRAAEDELVLRWLNEKPAAQLEASRTPIQHNSANAPELALTQIASELLPFNPVTVRLTGKTAEADMSATVERLEKLLASVDPPASLGTVPPGSMISASTISIRDPQGRLNSSSDEPQRRRSDQAIIYDTLLRRCLGDDDFAWRMLRKFPGRCRTELESLAIEIRRRAWIAATRRITQLRGMAANIAADNLREALVNLEHVCRQQSATRADQLLEGVHSEFQQILDFVARADGISALPEYRVEEQRPLQHRPTELIAD